VGLGQDDIKGGKNMTQLGLVTNLVLIGFSVLIGAMSIQLGVGDLSNMGPGFASLVACTLLFCTCSFVLILELRSTMEREKIEIGELAKPIGVCLALLGYTFLMTICGYLVMAFITTLALSCLTAPKKWVANTVFAGATALVSYAMFNWFGVGLPPGLFGLGW
jgi:hypothetical protein